MNVGDEMLKTDWQQLNILSYYFIAYVSKIKVVKLEESNTTCTQNYDSIQ